MDNLNPSHHQRQPRELLCLGRLAVDLYGEQLGCPLEDVTSFAKYLGGSSANLAVGASRLGLDVGMISRVGDEQMGTFLLQELRRQGVSTRGVGVDPKRLTALAILSIQDRDRFPLLFYRHDCADMALAEDDVPEDLVAGARALAITGTHLSQPGVRAAARKALRLARRHGARTVLDIDYRPVLWGLAGSGEGDLRYVRSREVSDVLQPLLPEFDLVVGTEEEFLIAGGQEDLVAAVRAVRRATPAVLVVKRGPHGCVIVDGDVPATLEQGLVCPGFPVEVFNVLGAGDAFLAGFLRGWLRGEPLATCGRWGNAAGALVVARHGCAPAMPSWEELQAFMARRVPPPRPWLDEALSHLHWAASREPRPGDLCALAFDHRRQMEDLAASVGADPRRVERFKELIADGLGRAVRDLPGYSPAVLVDDTYGQPVLVRAQAEGWWIARPTEVAGSRPLALEAGDALERRMRTWPRGQVAKCLVFHSADDPPELRQQQFATLRQVSQAAVATGHELLLEVIPPAAAGAFAQSVPAAVDQIYEAGIRPDWWKVPLLESREGWLALADVVARRDPLCRGALVLGLDAPLEQVARGFEEAARHEVCRGFAIGRTIFREPALAWLTGSIGDPQAVEQVAANFQRVLAAWRQARQGQVRLEAPAPAAAPMAG